MAPSLSFGIGLTTRQEQVAAGVLPPVSGSQLLLEDGTGHYLSELGDILVSE